MLFTSFLRSACLKKKATQVLEPTIFLCLWRNSQPPPYVDLGEISLVDWPAALDHALAQMQHSDKLINVTHHSDLYAFLLVRLNYSYFKHFDLCLYLMEWKIDTSLSMILLRLM